MRRVFRFAIATRRLLHAGLRLLLAPLWAAITLADLALTLGAAGLFLALVLAQPAFEETRGEHWLKQLDLSVTFLDRAGREIGHRGIRHDDRVEISELPPHLIDAVLAAEDRRFRKHWGIDPFGLARALAANVEADAIVQGGSTITQQLAKNLFLSHERTLERKINEAFLAVWLEFRLSKPELLKLYLDRVYMGAGAFGIEAAAQFYFGKSAREVNLAEAAMLAGLFRAPTRYAPHLDPAAAEARAAIVLDQMHKAGFIGLSERDLARGSPARVVPRQTVWQPGYFLDFAFRQARALAVNGRLGRESILVVETSLDREVQEHAEAAVARAIAREGGRVRVDQAAAVVMDDGGMVRAMVGGRDYGASQFNRAVDARRQPGSSFKPFVYAAAFTHTALRPESTVYDAPVCLGRWCPANYGRSFAGAMSVATALARSVNTVAVRLVIEIGRAAGEISLGAQARFGRVRTAELGRALGLTTPLRDTPSQPLGASEVTVLDMAAAFAAFANGGRRAAPSAIVSVRSARGQLLYSREQDPAAPRVLRPDVAANMTALLAKAVEAGTGKRAQLPGHPTAGKTGTSSAHRDAWFVGFTGHLVGAIWFGNDNDTPTRDLTGGALPAATWREIMSVAHRDLAPAPLPALSAARVAAAADSGSFQEVGRPAPSPGRGFRVLSAPKPFPARRP